MDFQNQFIDATKLAYLDSQFIDACEYSGRIDEAKRLLKAGVDPTTYNNLALGRASMNGNIEAVKLLLADPRVNPADWDNFALRKACENCQIQVVKLLLADGRADPTDKDNEAILTASRNGFRGAEIVQLLLDDPRVDPTAKDNLAICLASRSGNVEAVKRLLAYSRKFVDPSAKFNRAIRWASEYSETEIVKLLLADGRVNPKGEEGIRVVDNNKIVDILVFDNILCRVENENIDSIKNPVIKEKYLLWLYRIGGEKWTQARNTVEN